MEASRQISALPIINVPNTRTDLVPEKQPWPRAPIAIDPVEMPVVPSPFISSTTILA